MTPPLRFCFGLHLHQPVGNFDHVFEQHLHEVYRPLLQAFMDGEAWPVAIHLSGPLLEWLDDRAPAFVDEIGRHVRDGRLELLAAGHDEPILAVLPAADRHEQIARHREHLRRRFGAEVRGLWLTERVWEPTLPEALAPAGIDFALVDDRHFVVSGFPHAALHRHFLTESGGERLALFPIDERLRYLIPFRPTHELVAHFRARREAGDTLAILADDGEKFGGWPGTADWLYRQGWLADFLATLRTLRDAGEVALTRFDDALRTTPSGGLAYLPSASYHEMEGWSLPPEPARALAAIETGWGKVRLAGIDGGLLRGGHWRHFLVKYPESNRLHKTMVRLSRRCREAGDPAEARRAIGRAQCNDAYWHGVFGGLYLPFLRGALWRQLARAERLLLADAAPRCEIGDLDADGADDVLVTSPQLGAWIAPSRGGAIDVLLDLVREENVVNVLTRHREAYHLPPILPDGDGGPTADDGTASIHDLEGSLTEIPPIDQEIRALFVDRFVAPGTRLDHFLDGTIDARRSLARESLRAEPVVTGDDVTVVMRAPGFEKVLRFGSDGTIRCDWRWEPRDPDEWFVSELSWSTPWEIEAPDATRWDYLVETVARSERGFDRTVQGEAVVLRWPAGRGAASVVLRRPG